MAFIADDRGSRPRDTRTPKPAHVCQTSAGFEPRVTVVEIGSTVTFENCDSIYHSVFSVGGSRRFDTGLFAPGLERRVRFDRPGIVDLYCEIHPHSCGYVVVTSSRHVARPDSLGAFTLPPIKAGAYTLKAWHPWYGERSQTLHVSREGAVAVRLAF